MLRNEQANAPRPPSSLEMRGRGFSLQNKGSSLVPRPPRPTTGTTLVRDEVRDEVSTYKTRGRPSSPACLVPARARTLQISTDLGTTLPRITCRADARRSERKRSDMLQGGNCARFAGSKGSDVSLSHAYPTGPCVEPEGRDRCEPEGRVTTDNTDTARTTTSDPRNEHGNRNRTREGAKAQRPARPLRCPEFVWSHPPTQRERATFEAFDGSMTDRGIPNRGTVDFASDRARNRAPGSRRPRRCGDASGDYWNRGSSRAPKNTGDASDNPRLNQPHAAIGGAS
jgi:hypothetical protein